MPSTETATLALTYAQPPILIATIFVRWWRHLAATGALGALGLSRQRRPIIRAFECSVSGCINYGGPGSPGAVGGLSGALLALFLIYDLDFLFFLSEVTCFYHWAAVQAALVILYGVLVVTGVWVDNNVYSPTWAFLP